MKTSFREPGDYEDSDRSQENKLHQRLLQVKPICEMTGMDKAPKGELQEHETIEGKVEDSVKGSAAYSLGQWIAFIGWP